MLCYLCMDKLTREVYHLLPSAYLIPLMLPLYADPPHHPPPTSLYMWDRVDWLWDRDAVWIFSFSAQVPMKWREEHMHSANLNIAQYKIMSCCIITKWKKNVFTVKMFLPLTMMAHYCICFLGGFCLGFYFWHFGGRIGTASETQAFKKKEE